MSQKQGLLSKETHETVSDAAHQIDAFGDSIYQTVQKN